MAKIVVNPTSSARREIPLARTLVSIGRDPSNDVVLPDAMVSRRHAVIEYRGSQYFLRDCNSSNGSLVNGDRVSERSLRDGDLVAIGTARLLFREEAELEEGGGKVVQHPSAPRLQCPSCQADFRKGDLFCRQCGASLAPSQPPKSVCSSCGTVVPLPAKFCNACGSPLAVELAAAGASPRPHPPAPEPDPDPSPRPRDEPPAEPPREPIPPIEARAQPSPAASSAAAPAREATAVREHAPAPKERAPDREQAPARHDQAPARRTAPLTGRFGPRLAAGLLDAAAVALGQALIASPAVTYWAMRDAATVPSFVAVLLSVVVAGLAVAFGILYYLYYWGAKGATPGKRLLGLTVQNEDGTAPIGFARAGVRLLGYVVSASLFGLGFLMVAFGGMGLHDRIAGTRVVRRGRA